MATEKRALTSDVDNLLAALSPLYSKRKRPFQAGRTLLAPPNHGTALKQIVVYSNIQPPTLPSLSMWGKNCNTTPGPK
jgi:hypothetical protein